MKPLIEILYVAFIDKNANDLQKLPFFDQGFTNAVIWDKMFGIKIKRLSFAWNTSHSKFFYHHGNKFWENESLELRAGGVEKEFVPFLFHFMGCAGRSVSTQSGHQCKYERIQKFLKEEYDLEC